MKPFEYVRASSVAEAADLLGTKRDNAKLLAGGTDLLGEMKDYITTPARLISLRAVPGLNKIEFDAKKGTKVGALVTLSELAAHKGIASAYGALVQAIGFTAMPQIRNMATIGGNLCQRPRCWYYRDEHTHCLKKGGAKCYAVEGENQYHAILGGGPCYIVHPSDPAPALMALGASVIISNGKQERTVPLEEFFVLPETNLKRENVLAQNEIITHILIPASAPNTQSSYYKEREKDSYDWALSSCAAVVSKDSSNKVTKATIVLGGVAPIPWRAKAAEAALVGQLISETSLVAVAKAAVEGAKPMTKNGYKVPLTEVVVKRALLKTV